MGMCHASHVIKNFRQKSSFLASSKDNIFDTNSELHRKMFIEKQKALKINTSFVQVTDRLMNLNDTKL